MIPNSVPNDVDTLIDDLGMAATESTQGQSVPIESCAKSLPTAHAEEAELHGQDLAAHVIALRQILVDKCDGLAQLIRQKDIEISKLLKDNQNMRAKLLTAVPLPAEKESPSVLAVVPGAEPEGKRDAILASLEAMTTLNGRMTDRSRNGSLKQSPVNKGGRMTLQGRLRRAKSALLPKGERSRARLPKLLVDPDDLKDKLKNQLCKREYSVTDFYWETGYCQKIARHLWFEWTSTVFIMLNAVWIGIDTEFNHASTLADADTIFVVVENLFCCFFLMEWSLRFASLKVKLNGFKDFWFVFDTFLVGLMIIETWLFAIIAAVAGTDLELSLSIFRVLRLSRMARIARLVKSFPELAITIKAINLGLQSIFWTLVILLGVVYVFAIMFTQLLDGRNQPADDLANKSFGSLGQSISTLLLLGALPDQVDVMERLGEINWIYYLLMLCYLFMTTITLMNMMVATLCEVIRIISTVEKEQVKLANMKDTLAEILQETDLNHSGKISKAEFQSLLSIQEYLVLLNDLGIDVPGLVDLTDLIFDGEGAEIDSNEFTAIIFNLRDDNVATVKDVSEQTRMVLNEIKKVS